MNDFRRAFSGAAANYDATWSALPGVQRLRARAHERMTHAWQAGAHVLELNCGTGEDAIMLARRGIHVTATDASTGMLDVARTKIEPAGMLDLVELRRLAFDELSLLRGRLFDGALSMFGGLNCIGELSHVALDLAELLRPGASLFVAIMPACCPWEIVAGLAHGSPSAAFRRLRSMPVDVPVGTMSIPTWYHSVSQIRKGFSPHFRLVQCEGWNVISPPPASTAFRTSHPVLSSMLERLEPRIASRFPFNAMGDHVWIELLREW